MSSRFFFRALALSVILHAAILVPWRWPWLDASPPGAQVYLSATLQRPAAASRPVSPVPEKAHPQPTADPNRRLASADFGGKAPFAPPTPPTSPAAQADPLPPQEEAARNIEQPAPPEYPAAARRRGLEGCVLAEVMIGADGSVTDVSILESDHPGIFDQSMREAQRTARYQPANRAGVPVASRALAVAAFVLTPERQINCALRYAEQATRILGEGSNAP
jgi:TonB family protein